MPPEDSHDIVGCTCIGSFAFTGFAFGPDAPPAQGGVERTLWGVNNNDYVQPVDPATGIPLADGPEITLEGFTVNMDGLAVDPTTGAMYMASGLIIGGRSLVRISSLASRPVHSRRSRIRFSKSQA